ncbi:MAG TPA: NADH-quinone oxidoreductase subunit C [Actinomycetota bacterium]
MPAALLDVLAGVRERFPEVVSEPEEAFGETSIEVARTGLRDVVAYLRDEGPFELLADWSAVDYLGVEPPERRFLCAAVLASVRHPARVRVRVFIPQGDEHCPSLTGVWAGADALEREMFDFFGIRFDGHPDLRRIFMPDEWDGHPQRKDYPLGGTDVAYRGAFVPPPDRRGQPSTTSGYPGRLS